MRWSPCISRSVHTSASSTTNRLSAAVLTSLTAFGAVPLFAQQSLAQQAMSSPPALHSMGAIPIQGVSSPAADIAGLDVSQLILELRAGELQRLQLPLAVTTATRVSLSVEGETHEVELWPHSVRGPDFQLMVAGADGVPRPVASPESTTVLGRVVGLGGSMVAGSVRHGSFTGMVTFADGRESWGINPLPAGAATASGTGALHIVYLARDAVPVQDLVCGTLDDAQPAGTNQASPHADGVAADGTPSPGIAPLTMGISKQPMMIVDIGLDADVEAYTKFGSVDALQAHMESILLGASKIFEEYAGLTLQVQTLVIRTSEPDPYTKKVGSPLLDEVETEWLNGMGGLKPGMVQLFSGKQLPGIAGIGNLAGLCSQKRFACLVEVKAYSGYTLKVRLAAHEFGHVLGASHCDGTPDCGIMCPSACGSPTAFGWDSVTSMMYQKFPGSCLSFAAPPGPAVVAEHTPSQVTSFATGWISLFGTGFTQVESVTIDGKPMDSFFAKVISDERLDIRPEVGSDLGLGIHHVQVLGVGGRSEIFEIEVTGTDPPMLQVNSLVLAGGSLGWTWGGPAGDTALLLLSASPDTKLAGLHEVLSDATVFYHRSLDHLATGSATMAVVPPSVAGLNIHSQLVTYDTTGVTGTTAVKTTQVFGLP
jgi:hypothetical protein